MTSRQKSPFNLHFRPSGHYVEGPIRYAFGKTDLGAVVVARSQRGVCAILLGDDEASAFDQLRSAFPQAELVADPWALHHELEQIGSFIEQGGVSARLDLDVGGTPFQQRVWQFLCHIPAGQTLSYQGVAQALKMPAAARAVAGACAANVLAVAIPCHRVVRGDGTISGYRWGVERKRGLLGRESKT